MNSEEFSRKILSDFPSIGRKCAVFHVAVHQSMFKKFYNALLIYIGKVQVYRCSCLCADDHVHLIVMVLDENFFERDFRQHLTWGVFYKPIKGKREMIDIECNAIKYSKMRELIEKLQCPFGISFDDFQQNECLTMLKNLNISSAAAAVSTASNFPSYWKTLNVSAGSTTTPTWPLPPPCEI